MDNDTGDEQPSPEKHKLPTSLWPRQVADLFSVYWLLLRPSRAVCDGHARGRPDRGKRRLWALCACLVVVAGLLVFRAVGYPLVFTTVVIQGTSMEPAFSQGDVLLCARLPLRFGQVVVASEDDKCHGGLIVKRIHNFRTDGYGVEGVRLTSDNEPSVIYWAEVAEVKGVVLTRI